MIEAMEKYGGSFVKSLAACFSCADTTNYKKLLDAFPEYVRDYKKIATEEKIEKFDVESNVNDGQTYKIY